MPGLDLLAGHAYIQEVHASWPQPRVCVMSFLSIFFKSFLAVGIQVWVRFTGLLVYVSTSLRVYLSKCLPLITTGGMEGN
jgi:hypothetical protein